MNTKASTFRFPMPVYSDQCTIPAELSGPVAAMYAASSGAAFSIIALPSFRAPTCDVSAIRHGCAHQCMPTLSFDTID